MRIYSLQLPLPQSSDVTDMEARDGEDSVCPVSVAVYQEQCAVNAVYSVGVNYIDGNLIVFPWSEGRVYLNHHKIHAIPKMLKNQE